MAERFRAAFRNHPAGVAVVTADDGTGPAGLTATSVVSVSAEPALLAFSVSARSSAAPCLTRAGSVVVHLLGAGGLDLARRFATGGIDRFAAPVRWTRLPTGEPLLFGVDSWLRGPVADRVAAGDATVVIVRVEQVGLGVRTGPPLVYRDRSWYALGDAAALT
ncbi:flavin reductase (DIM6/NTAB) family NADH-FMN oxidoreductase RutF [Prauserella shujinwangii]|uniref:Flavin reductase (DIM6/NTAB) family NADH-FMN oxidoreductase RutF n=1 Tax=Prauserella shujinwangii TaxID=1453103 RepID=A0A2T0LZL9_9PSEU|nr:flavin reductase family protein [Prauserella shujinwangii]PRX49566.1 flavin reductase (DIM6/NTAB) family NADH-FMN oxidoreductase RutF [Prauserella shujinwangii]